MRHLEIVRFYVHPCVCVCVCVCILLRMWVLLNVYIEHAIKYMYICMYICMYVYLENIRFCKSERLRISALICMGVYMCVCVSVIYIYIYIYIIRNCAVQSISEHAPGNGWASQNGTRNSTFSRCICSSPIRPISNLVYKHLGKGIQGKTIVFGIGQNQTGRIKTEKAGWVVENKGVGTTTARW